MNINEMTIGQAREIAAMFGARASEPESTGAHLGQYCVIRTENAGVHVGTVKYVAGDIVTLTYARRIWYWAGAFTLSEVALNGVADGSKISVIVPTITLRGWVEIIPTGEAVEEQLRAVKAYIP